MIHEQAIVDSSASIGDDVTIGAFSIIGPDVTIGDGTWIGPHATINGPTTIGKNNKIFQYASVGDAPQDIRYDNEPTELIIGDDNVIRESVTINRGTPHGGGVTRIGNKNFLMAYSHVAHDCQVGNENIFANGTSLGGHVVVEDCIVFGGFALIHQFVHVGSYAFCAMGCGTNKNIPPYMMIAGNPATPHGINKIGLQRRGFSDDSLKGIRAAYKKLYLSKLKLNDAITELETMTESCQEIIPLVEFIKNSERSIVR